MAHNPIPGRPVTVRYAEPDYWEGEIDLCTTTQGLTSSTHGGTVPVLAPLLQQLHAEAEACL